MLRKFALAWLYCVGALALAAFAFLALALLTGGETIGLPWFFVYIFWGAGLAAAPGFALLFLSQFVGRGARAASTPEEAREVVLGEWKRWKGKSNPATWAEIHAFYSWLKASNPQALGVSGATVGWSHVQEWLAPFTTTVEPWR